MRSILLLAAALSTAAFTSNAQTARARVSSDDNDRAALGVNTSSGGKRDTLGLLITSVVPGSPAEKAGLEEGNRIQSINGVSLRLSAADAGERDMEGTMTRRLVRELRKVTPGAEVDLRVYAGGQVRTVKLKTTDVEELGDLERRSMRRMRNDDDGDLRPVIGLNFGGGGSKRDTLGIFVASVAENGPAEKAGIFEGARIAAINGIDLRVAREDAGDGSIMNAKANRFRRIMRDVKVGDNVELRVYQGGQTRTVTVKAGTYRDVYGERGMHGFFFGEGGLMMPDIDIELPRFHVTPRPSRAPMAPLPPGRVRIMDGGSLLLDHETLRRTEDALRRAEDALRRNEDGARRSLDAQRRAVEAMARRTVSM